MRTLQPPPADAPVTEGPGPTGGAPSGADLPSTRGARGPATENWERPRVRPRFVRRLLVALLLAGVLPVAVAGYLTWREQERVLRQEALDRAQQVAQLLANSVDRFARELLAELQGMADDPGMQAAILRRDWRAVQDALTLIAAHEAAYRGVLVVDEHDTVRVATGVTASLVGKRVPGLPAIAEARRRGAAVVSDPFLSPVDQRPVIGLAVPILPEGQRAGHMLGAGVDLTVLLNEVQRARVGTTGFAIVQTADGRFIVHPDPSRIFQLALEANRAGTLLRRGARGALETTRPDGTQDFTGFATVPTTGWVVLTHIPAKEALASLAASRQRTLTLLAWLMAMVGALALVYGRVLARPMSELAEAAQALGAGDLSRRVPADRNDEIGQVALAFNEMADRRQEAEAALQRSLDRRDALAELSAAIAAGTDMPGIMGRVVGAAAGLLGAPYAALWTVGPDGHRLLPAAEFADAALGPLPPQQPIPVEGTFNGAVLRGGGPVASADVRRDPRWVNRAWPGLERLGAYLGISLCGNEGAAGILTVMDGPGRAFTEEEVELLRSLSTQAAIAIENARLYQEQRAGAEHAERQRARAEALAAVGQALATSLDPDQVLTLIVERTAAVTGADAVAVLQRDAATGELRFRRACGLTQKVDRHVLSPGQGIAGAALAAGRPFWTRDLQSDPRFSRPGDVHPLVAQEGIRAVLSVPIQGRGEAYGVLSLYRRRLHQFDEEEIAFSVRIAAQAAIAIENARLYEDIQRRAREATALAEVGTTLSASLDLDRVFESVVEGVQRVMAGAFAGIMILDEARQELAYVKGAGLSPDHMAGLRLKVGEGIAGRAVALGAPAQSSSLLDDPRYVAPRLTEAQGFRSLLCAPLLAGGRPLGALALFRRDHHEFSPAEGELLTRFAQQASLAIENARLYEQVASHAETLEQRVRERMAELEAANRAKSEFLANMSHELRTPLNAIIGFADLLQMPTFGPLTPKQQRYVNNIQTSGVHLLNLVNDVLDLARVEAGRLELRRERTPLPPVLAQALEVFRPQAEKKGLTLTHDVPPDLPPLHADPVRLHQILVNLLSNAVKFTERGGRLAVRAARARTTEGEYLEVAVQDTGIGIAPEDMGRLFRKFEQLDAGLAKGHQGTGLGLALTRHLVELHGGTITAHSAGRGQGSTFVVCLPVGPQRERPEVLVVDDDPLVREMLTASARDWGWEAAAAATLAEARACVNQALPDLVILDSSLPDGSGLDFAHELRRVLARHVRVLMYTGLGAAEGQAALAAGADDYLVKPAPMEMLHRKASKLLARAGWPGPPKGNGAGTPEGPTAGTDQICSLGRER